MAKWKLNPDTCEFDLVQAPGSGTAAIQFDADTGTANPDSSGDVEIFGGEAIDTTASGNTVTISAELATAAATVGTANLGVAAFADTDFTVVGGFVTLKASAGGTDTFVTDSGTATQSGGSINVIGGTGIDTSGSGDTVTVTLETPVTVSHGGTGRTSLTDGGVIVGDGVNAVEQIPLTDGQLLIGDTSANPVASTLTAGSGIDITNGAGSITIALTGGGTAIDSVTIDDAGAGTNPVVPDSNGNISITGAVKGNDASLPVETRSDGANSFQVRVQRAIASNSAAASLSSGIAYYFDEDFTVSVAGRVDLADTVVKSVAGDSGTATPSGHSFTIAGSTGLTTAGASDTVTISLDGSVVGQTITGDSGGALSPTSGNWNILGLGETSTSGSGSTLSILSPRVATWIVDPTSNNGTHTTISSAISDASSGDSIFIRPGTYTENLTMKSGLSVAAITGNAPGGLAVLTGQIDVSAGTCTIANLIIKTNGAEAVVDTGAAVTNQSEFRNCNIFLDDADAISIDNSASAINFRNCGFRQTADTLDVFNITDCGTVTFEDCEQTLSASLIGTSNIASGTVRLRYSKFNPHAFTTSSSGQINARYCRIDNSQKNTTALTTAGTGNSTVKHCIIETGNAAALSAGSGTTIEAFNNTIDTTGNALAGSGTVVYSGNNCSNTGSSISTTTQTPRYSLLGKWRAPGQPSFLARPDGTKLNKTGNGTVYTIVFDDEVYDQGSDFDGSTTFTAPVGGKYLFTVGVHLSGITASGTFLNFKLVTSNHDYQLQKHGDIGNNTDSGNIIYNGSALVDMDSGETATVTIQTGGEGSDVVDVVDSSAGGTFFSGILLS